MQKQTHYLKRLGKNLVDRWQIYLMLLPVVRKDAYVHAYHGV